MTGGSVVRVDSDCLAGNAFPVPWEGESHDAL